MEGQFKLNFESQQNKREENKSMFSKEEIEDLYTDDNGRSDDHLDQFNKRN